MKDVQIFSKEELPLRPAMPGTAMWAVAVDKAMLTYFEAAPGVVFPEHTHEAEQITLVAKGELLFHYQGKTVSVKEGGAIAVASNVPHGLTVGPEGCVAVDAWSPIRKDFLPKSE